MDPVTWVVDHAATLRQVLVVAAAALVGYLVLRTLVRTVLPWLIRLWLVPLGKALDPRFIDLKTDAVKGRQRKIHAEITHDRLQHAVALVGNRIVHIFV